MINFVHKLYIFVYFYFLIFFVLILKQHRYLFQQYFQNDYYLTLLKQGNVRLETTFGTALAKTITCIIYAEYPGF